MLWRRCVDLPHNLLIGQRIWRSVRGACWAGLICLPLFHGTPRDLSHNMGHVDGHVKTHNIPDFAWNVGNGRGSEVFDNDQYKFGMPDYAY